MGETMYVNMWIHLTHGEAHVSIDFCTIICTGKLEFVYKGIHV
jgi:hypothetical protein